MTLLTPEQKKLVIVGLVLLALALVVDLIMPGLMVDLKKHLPRNVREKLPLVEVGIVVGGGLYLGGTITLQFVALRKQRASFKQIGQQGRTWRVVLPRDSEEKGAEMAALFARIWDTTKTAPGPARWGQVIPFSLEYVGWGGQIHCQMWIPEIQGRNVADTIRLHVIAHYRRARVRPDEDLLQPLRGDETLSECIVLELRLAGPSHYPIRPLEDFPVDPLAGLLQTLLVEPGAEFIAIQMVLMAVQDTEWKASATQEIAALRAATAPSAGGGGKSGARVRRSLTPEEKEKIELLTRVSQQRGFDTTIRLVLAGSDKQRLELRKQQILGVFEQFTSTLPMCPQSFRQFGRPAEFTLGPQQVPTALSESKITLMRDLQRMMGERSGDDGSGDGCSDKPAPPPPPVMPVLLRMPTPAATFFPPWKQGRRGGVMQPESLATVLHFPHKDIAIPGLVVTKAKHIPPPQAVLVDPKAPPPEGYLVLAAADEDRDPPRLVAMPRIDLRRGGAYILGPAGSGKSYLAQFWGDQFTDRGWGLGVIDPKEDLVRNIAVRVPIEREPQVVLFYPGLMRRPAVVNLMDARLVEMIGAEAVAAGVLAVFAKIMGTNWDTAINVQRILSMAVTALCLGEPEPSFLRLYQFLAPDTEENPNAYRAEVVSRVQDPVVQRFWVKEFPELNAAYGGSIVSVTTRVEKFLRSLSIRYLCGLPYSTIDFSQIMNDEMIFLGAVPASLGDNQGFVGALLFNRIVGAGFGRYTQIPNEDDRRDFTIIVDEFQRFAASGSKDMEDLLSMLRGARVSSVLAHQSTAQISEDTLQIILANNQTRVIFSLQAQRDARVVVGPWQTDLTVNDLMGLETSRYEVYMSCLARNMTMGPFSARTLRTRPPRSDALGDLPAEGFRWPVRDPYDEWVVRIAALEEALLDATSRRDKEEVEAIMRQGVSLLQELHGRFGPAAYARYEARRRERDQALRAFIVEHPAVVPDKLERINVLSSLASGVPAFEAEFRVGQALQQGAAPPGEETGTEEPALVSVDDFLAL